MAEPTSLERVEHMHADTHTHTEYNNEQLLCWLLHWLNSHTHTERHRDQLISCSDIFLHVLKETKFRLQLWWKRCDGASLEARWQMCAHTVSLLFQTTDGNLMKYLRCPKTLFLHSLTASWHKVMKVHKYAETFSLWNAVTAHLKNTQTPVLNCAQVQQMS